MSIYKHDRLTFVLESVESILNQTFSNFHYYLIFDGPVSLEIEKYITALKDDRIRLLRLERNSGLAVALNTLLEVVLKNPEYRYIARMDADDISIKKRFQIQREFMINNPEIFCVGSWYEEIDENGKIIFTKEMPVMNNEIGRYLRKTSPIAHPSVMFRSEFFAISGLYPTDTNRLEDYALWAIAYRSNVKFANISEYLLAFRIDKNFYRRRSGLKYGFDYIVTKFRILRLLNLPLTNYIYSLTSGVAKMLPPFMVHYLYSLAKRNRRKYKLKELKNF